MIAAASLPTVLVAPAAADSCTERYNLCAEQRDAVCAQIPKENWKECKPEHPLSCESRRDWCLNTGNWLFRNGSVQKVERR